MSSLSLDVHALRKTVGWAVMPRWTCVVLRGVDALEAADALSPRDLYVREGQALQTLLLDSSGAIRMDLFFCARLDEFLLVGAGLSGPQLMAEVEARVPAGLDIQLEDLTERYTRLCIAGPYAWELMMALLSPELLGLPYLGFYEQEGLFCLRTGSIGEYGYDLLLEESRRSSLQRRLEAVAGEFGGRNVATTAFDVCAVENGVFQQDWLQRQSVTPVEMQLQWRVRYGRDFVGRAALRAQVQTRSGRRSLMLVSSTPMQAEDPVYLDGQRVGSVLVAAYSPIRDDFVAVGLVIPRCCYPGLTGLSVGESTAFVRARSAPAVNNRSLWVNPQQHSFETRDIDAFAPLVFEVTGHG